MAGVMNAHSRRWDPRCRQQRNATFWEEIIDQYRLEIGNDDRPTHHSVRTEHRPGPGHSTKHAMDHTGWESHYRL